MAGGGQSVKATGFGAITASGTLDQTRGVIGIGKIAESMELASEGFKWRAKQRRVNPSVKPWLALGAARNWCGSIGCRGGDGVDGSRRVGCLQSRGPGYYWCRRDRWRAWR